MTTTQKKRQAHDCDGSPLKVGDCVSPADYSGRRSEAPVYTVTRICTDSETIQLRRADGSILYREAAEVRYLPETTAASLKSAL